MSVEPRVRQRLEPDERRAQIMKVARGLFGEYPYEAVATTDIARAAGVARGLINHYFGDKRGLYLAVVRQLVTAPSPIADDLPNSAVERRVTVLIDRWLDLVERNASMWLTAIGSEAAGRDPEIDEILFQGDEIATDWVIQAARLTEADECVDELRAAVRSFGSMMRAASREWLVRGAFTRSDLHVLLTDTLLHLLNVTFPALCASRRAAR
ncbi:helix-turn-helix domain-containing protein [Streptomyces sp. NPDC093544]|jgi:AcrR family transcriptional regulator|uniref:TetR/AcrR family transcriptional regulator n=1 Tax=Streptomyces sp. NPDC093544 TaxID=3155200 RepID=UPI0034171164